MAKIFCSHIQLKAMAETRESTKIRRKQERKKEEKIVLIDFEADHFYMRIKKVSVVFSPKVNVH